MRKRIVSFLLAAAMVLALAPAALAAKPAEGLSNFKKVNTYTQGQFSDVPAGQWYSANVKASYEMNLMLGKGDGRFGLGDSVTIMETVTLAARIHSIYHTGSANFVQGSPWYQVYVDYAIANGIIGANEYPDYTVKATRAQFTKIMAASVPESALQAINDVTAGEVHDLPANRDYAEAAYLLYNAGIITGTDSYGTFKANAEILRSEAVTIVTRIVDTTLRKKFEPEVYDSDPPTGLDVFCFGGGSYVATDQAGNVVESYSWKEYVPGQKDQFEINLSPVTAQSGIAWVSSNPEVASVNQHGQMEIHKPGEAIITATTYNGVSALFKAIVSDPGEQLQYALTADGKGYEIVGCDSSAYTAHIPAEYNGLPVVSIKGGAFMSCTSLRYFTVDENQLVYYAEDGVIFADLPEKTLVCFPPAYDAAQYYYVPKGTVAIAPYAFAGIHAYSLRTITMQEGLTTLGDYAFAGAGVASMIYTPDSLTTIGTYILQGQTSSISFYGDWNSAMGQYATTNQIPFAGIMKFDPGENTTMELVPQSIPADGMSNDSGVPVKLVSELESVYYGRDVKVDYDLTDYQKDFSGEVYLQLNGQWGLIVPDKNGNVCVDMPPQTGLYGVGYTATDTVLRSYDRYGNLLAIQYVSGNFAFCFPGASNLGVVGGSETVLSMIPYEPVYLISGGNYPLQADQWYTTEQGSAYQFFIQQYPSGSIQQIMPNYLNVFVAGNYSYGDDELESGYQIGFVELYDQSRIDGLTVSLVFDGQICVVDNDEMVCLVNGSFEGASTFGDRALDMWRRVKEVMSGDYYPAEELIQKIYVYGDGTWPSAGLNIVYMSEEIVNGEDDLTLAHEFVHAVDMSIPAFMNLAVGAWAEGRAEYISSKLFGEEDTIYTEYDWSYLSEEDKADFFRFFYFSTNRWTQYPVGTLFLRYLNETYGEDVSSKVMANMAALTEWDSIQGSEANALLFKQCVEAATEVGVFQNFVRDVIEK